MLYEMITGKEFKAEDDDVNKRIRNNLIKAGYIQ